MIAAGYAAVIVLGGLWFLARYVWELRHQQDISGGMSAFGDLILALGILSLLLVPTFFLLRLLSQYESISTTYSKVLLIVSVTIPICLGLLAIGPHGKDNFLVELSQWRILFSPFVLAIMILSRIVARFKPAKRFTTCASLCEGLTFVLAVALFLRK